MKTWRTLLLVAAFIACVPFTARADDPVVATDQRRRHQAIRSRLRCVRSWRPARQFPAGRSPPHAAAIRHRERADGGGRGEGRSRQRAELRGPAQISSPPRLAGCVFRQERAECRARGRGQEDLRRQGRRHEAGGRDPRPPYSGRDRGRGQGNPGAAEEGRGFRHGRQGEVEGPERRRRRSRLFRPRPDAEALRGRGLRD